MAVNLRLRPEAEEALRATAERSHRSQQDILRDALDYYLDVLANPGSRAANRGNFVAPANILTPRTPYRKVTPRLTLPAGTASLDLLDREDRF